MSKPCLPCEEKARQKALLKKKQEIVEAQAEAVATPSVVDDSTIPRMIKIVRPTFFRGKMYNSGEFIPTKEEGKAFVSAYKTSDLIKKSIEIIN